MYTTRLILSLLCITSVIALPKEIENAASNESQPAKVQEIAQPPMTVQDASAKLAIPQEYILPGYYTFNKGEPFFVEKDPLTGTIDFNKKTTPKSAENDEPESDYFYDDQDVDDGIDRKDGSIEGPNSYRPNDIFQNPYKISPDLHQFLNLPVHYSSSDKFPLISSSYANTKIQGTGGSSTYSNHKYVTTSSTQSPSYYTMPTTKYTTIKPTYQSTTARTTTGYPATKSTTTTEADEYDNNDYNEYEEEDSIVAGDNQAVASQQQTYKPDTTKYSVTTYRPTTYRFTTPTIKTKTSSVPLVTDKPKQQVSIVTSLPLDVYYSSSQESLAKSSTTTTTTTSAPPPTITTVNSTTVTDSTQRPSQTTTEAQVYNNPAYNIPNEGIYTGFGEQPFRPIYGPSDSSVKVEGNNKIQYNKNEFIKQKPNTEFHRLPPHQHIPYLQRQPPLTIKPDMEPPRPDAPLTYYPEQPMTLLPGQQASISFGEQPKISPANRPLQDNLYERPPPPPLYNQEASSPAKLDPQDPTSSQKRPDIAPVYENRPEKLVPNVKPRPVQDYPVKSNFKMPSKVENHFIKVSPDQENPSYSLQTSFSIGVPGPTIVDKDKPEAPQSQGVGQVLFTDNTPAENVPVEASNVNPNLPSPVLRPPGNRVPIQTYQPNRPGYRQPINIQPKPSVPYRVPNDELRPPSDADNYPRPHWESHGKPFYGPTHNAIPKKDIVLPQGYPGLSRGKPDKIQRPDLPNILPQFRPNAKLGSVDYYQPYSVHGERPREPLDTLQPPPLPQPLHLRINRNDDELEIDREGAPGDVANDPLVHRRSGPQLSRVTTLQMMQQSPLKKPGLRSDVTLENRQSAEKEKPVFLVYPSSHGLSHKSPPEEVVVIGTRAQRPIPPAHLPEKDDLDNFQLDDNKQFPIPGRDRVDTPILKTKPAKPPVKNDFPYTILKPNSNDIPEERILTVSEKKEYTEYSPTPASSTEENREEDSEINLIPYLQDYMPFATKKPLTVVKPIPNVKKDTKLQQKPQVISTTLNASLATAEKPSNENDVDLEKNGSEMTLSATIYTQPRPSNHKVPVTYTPSEPQPLNFQAPFLASLSAPESQGWSVVTDKNLKPATEAPAEIKAEDNDDGKFDIENFKPQLFGGFKPIMLSSDEDSESAVGVVKKDKDVLLNKGDREERNL